ncbi:cobalt ABC transporter ATP-binding protein [Paenibacillus polymyxa]|uniref:ABC transporter ATP-binding protein n=1 Tax=Paenibacillus polymyxa TaxID=1406 RepID=UPI000D309E07|nr:ABC transporter ATP-binding protein [Paenibacillus polymyxa]PTU44999.1 cobalt ABC transporter ATP-binding protein [Paenibacillus polymyxa]
MNERSDHDAENRIAVSLRDFGYRYDDQVEPALHGLTLDIAVGEHIAIVGASGSGKSTLCQLLHGGLSRSGEGERTGELTVYGMDPATAELATVATTVGVVLQDPDAQLVQGIVEDEIAFGPENLRVPPAEIEQRLAAALEAVGLASERGSSVRRLSGGQRQRTAIAAVLALEVPLVVFDDAAAQLDPPAVRDFVLLCRRLHAAGRTVITASGRIDDGARAAQRLIVLKGGTMLLQGPPEKLLREHGAQLAAWGLLPSSAGREDMPREPEGNADSAAYCAGQPLLEVKGLPFTYPGSQRAALKGVSLALAPGERAVMLGENGSGKTTLGKLLMGLLPAPKGCMWWEGQDMSKLPIHRLAAGIGYVFQQPEHQFAAATVWEECLYSVRVKLGLRIGDPVPAAYEERAHRLLTAARLDHRLEVSPYLLSGGEKRLLSVAAQFILPKKLYILDEPTAGTDYEGANILLQMCTEQSAEGAAFLIITHDLQIAERFASHVLRMEEGYLYKTEDSWINHTITVDKN